MCNGYRKCMPHTTQFSLVLHIVHPRWRYHYKLHGINIHLPIYSMSCGSNTIHVLLLLHLFDSLSLSLPSPVRAMPSSQCTYTHEHDVTAKMSEIEKFVIICGCDFETVCVSMCSVASHLSTFGAQQHWPLANTNIRCEGEKWREVKRYTYVTMNKAQPIICVVG